MEQRFGFAGKLLEFHERFGFLLDGLIHLRETDFVVIKMFADPVQIAILDAGKVFLETGRDDLEVLIDLQMIQIDATISGGRIVLMQHFCHLRNDASGIAEQIRQRLDHAFQAGDRLSDIVQLRICLLEVGCVHPFFKCREHLLGIGDILLDRRPDIGKLALVLGSRIAQIAEMILELRDFLALGSFLFQNGVQELVERTNLLLSERDRSFEICQIRLHLLELSGKNLIFRIGKLLGNLLQIRFCFVEVILGLRDFLHRIRFYPADGHCLIELERKRNGFDRVVADFQLLQLMTELVAADLLDDEPYNNQYHHCRNGNDDTDI